MNISAFIFEFKSALKNQYSDGELDQLLIHIFEDVLNYRRIDLSIKKEEELPNSILERLQRITAELQSNKPIQYILGYAWFAGMKLKVNSSVLIPRQETEELVDWIVRENSLISPSIIDVCSGSGCIALELKKMIPNSVVRGIEISDEAILLSTSNANSLELNVEFYHLDILKDEFTFSGLDIIVSNPPYVKQSESEFMKTNVLDFEPHLALFVPENDPLLFYKRVAFLAFQALKKGGKLYFEINENLSSETAEVLELQGFHDISIRKDLNNKYRMIRAIR